MKICDIIELYQPQPKQNGALDPAFNQAVLRMASLLMPNGYSEQPHDDKRAEDVWSRFDSGQPIVPSNNSQFNIFADPQVNVAFRAWHDWTHWKLKRTFSNVHEGHVNEKQKQDLIKVFGRNPRTLYWCKIIDAENVGQLEYKAKFGQFPHDQYAFDVAYLKGKGFDRHY